MATRTKAARSQAVAAEAAKPQSTTVASPDDVLNLMTGAGVAETAAPKKSTSKTPELKVPDDQASKAVG